MNFRIFRFSLSWLVLLGAAFFSSPEMFAQKAPDHLPTFAEQFIFSAVTLESGSARLIGEDGNPQGAPIPPGSLLKTESTIGIDSEGIAEIRLGCNSIVRLAPGSRLKIRPFGLEFLSGSIMARHVGSYFPLKIQGAATLLVSKDSLVDAERQGEKVLARVQVGKMRTPGMKEPVVAGQSIEASGRNASITPFGPLPRPWDSPSLTNSGNPPVSGNETLSEDLTDQDEPANPVEAGAEDDPPPTRVPDTGEDAPVESIEGENWMKEPIPVGQDSP
jgi:hypothetical protein